MDRIHPHKPEENLIYASISGYGNTGASPYGSRPAFAPAADAMAGLPYLASGPDGVPLTNTFGAIIDTSQVSIP